MKKSMKYLIAASATICLLGSASLSMAQYGNACSPAYELPTVEACAPSCDVPTCEPSYAPTCDAGYVPYGCNPCVGFISFFDDVARVAATPFHWIACAFADGIYPDCGCAPRPAKTYCDPCTVCGDYVGGCNDGSCYNNDACSSYANNYQSYNSQGYAAPSGYSVPNYYDVESYDASPSVGSYTRQNVTTGGFTHQLRNVFSPQRPAEGNITADSSIRYNSSQVTVNYPAPKNSVRHVSYSEAFKSPNVQRPQVELNPVSQAFATRSNGELQGQANERIISSSHRLATPTATGKTFGTTRPIK